MPWALLLGSPMETARQEPASAPASKPASAPVAAERIFSGPQAGEATPKFTIQDVTAKRDPKEFDPVAEAAGGKTLYYFFPADVTRLVARGITNISILADAAKARGLRSYFVALTADPITADQRLRDVWGLTHTPVPASISLEGLEGPGAWGLNRKCIITVVLAENGIVQFNYAAMQPADADYVTLQKEVEKLVGAKLDVKLNLGNDRRMMGGDASSRAGGERNSDARSRRARAQADLRAIDTAIRLYKDSNQGKLPTALVRLIEPDDSGIRFIKNREITKDPWMREYRYEVSKDGATYELFTLGADGRDGGEGEDADIFVQKIAPQKNVAKENVKRDSRPVGK